MYPFIYFYSPFYLTSTLFHYGFILICNTHCIYLLNKIRTFFVKKGGGGEDHIVRPNALSSLPNYYFGFFAIVYALFLLVEYLFFYTGIDVFFHYSLLCPELIVYCDKLPCCDSRITDQTELNKVLLTNNFNSYLCSLLG